MRAQPHDDDLPVLGDVVDGENARRIMQWVFPLAVTARRSRRGLLPFDADRNEDRKGRALAEL